MPSWYSEPLVMHGYTQKQFRFWVYFSFQLDGWSIITYYFDVVLWHLEELSMSAVGSALTRRRDIFWLGSFIFKTRHFPTNYLEVIVQFSVSINFMTVYWLSLFALCRIKIGKHGVYIASRFQRYESLFILILLIIAITLHPSDLLLLRNESYWWCSPRQERSNWAVRCFANTVVRSNLLPRGGDSTFDLVFAPNCSRNFFSEWNNVVILVKHDQWCPSPIRLWHGFNLEFVGVWLRKLISICLHGPLLVCNLWFDQALISNFVGWNLVWFDLV